MSKALPAILFWGALIILTLWLMERSVELPDFNVYDGGYEQDIGPGGLY